MSKLGNARWDPETCILLTPGLVILQQLGNVIRYHGFAGEETFTLYRDWEAARRVLETLDPAAGWVIQRVGLAHHMPDWGSAEEDGLPLADQPPKG